MEQSLQAYLSAIPAPDRAAMDAALARQESLAKEPRHLPSVIRFINLRIDDSILCRVVKLNMCEITVFRDEPCS